MKTKNNNSSHPPSGKLGIAGGEDKSLTNNSNCSRSNSYKKDTPDRVSNKAILKKEIELFLEKKLELGYNELQFKIKEVDQNFILIEILEPVHHSKGVPIKEFQKFLLEELEGGSSDR